MRSRDGGRKGGGQLVQLWGTVGTRPRGVIKIRMMKASQESRRASVGTALRRPDSLFVAPPTGFHKPDGSLAQLGQCGAWASLQCQIDGRPRAGLFSPTGCSIIQVRASSGETPAHPARRTQPGRAVLARKRRDGGEKYSQQPRLAPLVTAVKAGQFTGSITNERGCNLAEPGSRRFQEALHAKLMDRRGSFHTAVTCCCCDNTPALARKETASR